LGQLYESGEGVPANADLARAWYAAADLPEAREHLAETRSAADRPALVQAPEPLFPVKNSALEPGLQQVDLVWTSPIEPEAVRFFVELRILDARASREAWSGFVDVSGLRLPLPPGVQSSRRLAPTREPRRAHGFAPGATGDPASPRACGRAAKSTRRK
jgi:hypothetical protein